jgi:hypothetical protein
MEGCTGWKLMDIEYGKELIDYPYCQLQEFAHEQCGYCSHLALRKYYPDVQNLNADLVEFRKQN